ncbi:LytR C-terminal domain-containing protein [Microbacterium deminutum]|uniref:LytR/CpsA/Psr regulator C-terminal domain-containing protein n=1 Tax=Microbacterium deminutum TaxID=344164 RepID=A0ABN2RBX3_9MICO
MPQTTFPRDRFDDLPDAGRVGAHRAENPRMRGWVVLIWAAIATIVLIIVGIFGTLIASGRIELFPTPSPTATPLPTVEAVVDTSYEVLILNATPQAGLATQLKDVVVAAGWPVDSVLASEAGSNDFAETTVYYLKPEDQAAALGLAGVIGGAKVEQSDIYQPADPRTPQLTIVIGLDRTAGAASPTPTP